mmetsp:Transcript_2448/g.4870  ORF Transcript_2448/g.4870 Transcript_2448/m.4870 type:complete len:268 (-) Transcript_2448:8-811(-)
MPIVIIIKWRRLGKLRRRTLSRHTRIPPALRGHHGGRSTGSVHGSGLIRHGAEGFQFLAFIHHRRRRNSGSGLWRGSSVEKFVIGLVITTANGVESVPRRSSPDSATRWCTTAAAAHGHSTPRLGHTTQNPPSSFRGHPSYHNARPTWQNHGFVVIGLVRRSILDGQVEFEGGVGTGGIEFFGSYDGTFDIEETSGCAREREGLEVGAGTEFVEDGGRHGCCLFCGVIVTTSFHLCEPLYESLLLLSIRRQRKSSFFLFVCFMQRWW